MLAIATHAQPNSDLQPVTVYGSRFQETIENALPQTIVVSSNEIQKSGLTNVADILKKLGNIPIRQDLYGNTNATIDMGGFGDAADNNVVILLDGVRISENEQSSARISLIPVEVIQHIEITRGGNSVLYGDGANGGVINIITKKNLDNISVVSGSVGSYDTYKSSLYTSKKFGDVSASIFGQTNNSKGYRDNNQTASRTGGGIIQWQPNSSTVAGLRVFADEQRNSLAGTLPLAWVNNNPKAKQQSTYSEQFSAESSNVTFFSSTKIEKIEYAIDITERNKHSNWQYDKDKCQISDPNGNCSIVSPYRNSYSVMNSSSKTQQINPRVKVDDFLLKQNKLTLGFDWLNWNFDRNVPLFDLGASNVQNNHSTKGIYFNSDWTINNKNRVTAGYRTERFKQEKKISNSSESSYGSDSQRISAHNIQYTRTINALQAFAKHGKNYRLPNADDNNQLTPFSWRQISVPLKPQTSIDNELGLSVKQFNYQYSISYYKSSITNEIGYDEATYGNNNYPSSKRSGIIANGKHSLTNNFGLRAQVQTINSKILAGNYSGKTLPGVPDYVGSIGFETKITQKQLFDVSYRTVGKSHFSGDNLNTQNRTAKQHYVDLRYNLKHQSWDWTASINNFLDKKQYDYAIYKPNYLPLYQNTVYPVLGRTFMLTGRYVF